MAWLSARISLFMGSASSKGASTGDGPKTGECKPVPKGDVQKRSSFRGTESARAFLGSASSATTGLRLNDGAFRWWGAGKGFIDDLGVAIIQEKSNPQVVESPVTLVTPVVTNSACREAF